MLRGSGSPRAGAAWGDAPSKPRRRWTGVEGGGNWWRPRHPLGSTPSEEQGIPFTGELRCTVTGDFGKH